MTQKEKSTFDLLLRSTRICMHCDKFKTVACPFGPKEADRVKSFRWNQLSSCEFWKPDEEADEALQILTMRKIRGDEDFFDENDKYK